jgi:hypothetical protein
MGWLCSNKRTRLLSRLLSLTTSLIELLRAGILNVRSVLMVCMEQHFVQASPIKYFATSHALRKVLLFFGWKLFVFLSCHYVALDSRYGTFAS